MNKLIRLIFFKPRKSCFGCKYYKQGQTYYDYYNECSLLGYEYFTPKGCNCVNDYDEVSKIRLKKLFKEEV